MKELTIVNENGTIGTGQTLTDLERNNRLLDRNNKIMIYFAFLLTVIIGIVIWVIYYTIKNEVVNNIVQRCVC